MKTIKMLCGQQGPEVSRLPGQVLTVGVDIDADEAQRLVDHKLAIDAGGTGETTLTPVAKPKAAAKAKTATAPGA